MGKIGDMETAQHPQGQASGRDQPASDFGSASARAASVQPLWTHLALRCSNLDRSIEFYIRWCGLQVVHRREDPSPDGHGAMRVAWLSRVQEGSRPEFWMVLLEVRKAPGATSLFDHLGFALGARAEVDALAERARSEGILHWPPSDNGPVVGYLCGIKDPDGNVVEFSVGQRL